MKIRSFISMLMLWSGIALAQGLEVRELGARWGLFIDPWLIEKMDGTHLRMHHPVKQDAVLDFDQQWEGPMCGYPTVIKDGAKYYMYYRGMPMMGKDGSEEEVTCVALSGDGIRWEKPELGIVERFGSTANNIVLNEKDFSHNFSPFIDTRPGVPGDERFKAVAGTFHSGLFIFVSGDGLHWRKMKDEAVFKKGGFDSQNVCFWSEREGRYVLYYRTWTQGGWKGFRTISKAVSDDLVNWENLGFCHYGAVPYEHLYTNQTTPYYRDPHLYVALPMRFMPGKSSLTKEQIEKLGLFEKYGHDVADVGLMTNHEGKDYIRTFMESFIRPGNDPGNWASRAGMSVLGIVPSADSSELYIYKQQHYAQPSAHLARYSLRLDGFASVHAGYEGGSLLTKAFIFTGNELVLNLSTSAVGNLRVEIRDADNRPIPGYTLNECEYISWDSTARTVHWGQGSDVSALEGQAVRLYIEMMDADLYSFSFK